MKNNISIVIPTFNRADLLAETIESCLAQTVPTEIIVCDHGSSDHTPEIAQSFGEKIKYIRNDRDFGPHFCWLDGLLNATGDLVHLQFDDDLIDPEFIEKTSSLISEDVGFVFTSACIFYTDGRKEILFANAFDDEIVPAKRMEAFLLDNMLSPACILIRKADIIDALYQGRLPFQKHDYHGVGPDYFVSLLCLLRYKQFGYVNSPLARFRAHDGSITIDAHLDSNKIGDFKKAYQEVVDYYLQLKLRRYIKPGWLHRKLRL